MTPSMLAVYCSSCGAAPGVPCNDHFGPVNGYHMDRIAEAEQRVPRLDFATFVDEKIAWSRATFGPQSIVGLRKHIDKELAEIDKNPADLMEWVDLILLALDGACRVSVDRTGDEVVAALLAKMEKNRARRWIKTGTDDAIEHDRSGEP